MSMLLLMDDDGPPFPRSLFSAGEQGIWLDPSDFSTMFQDSAGTVPVTAVEQPVGLVLDKSQGLVLSGEKLTNGDFSAGTASWSLSAGFTVSGGKLNISASTGTAQNTSYLAVVGSVNQRTLVVDSLSGGSLYFGFSAGDIVQISAPGTYVLTGATNTANYVAIGVSTGTVTAVIDLVGVKKLAGNHASQTTSASRPTLQQDSNGLYYLSFDGTDDGMATPSIDFTGTDKMSVFAGVYFSDATGFDGVLELVGSATPGSLWVYGNASSIEAKTRGSGGVSSGWFVALSGASQSVYSVSFNLAGAAFSYCVALRKNGTTVTNVGRDTAGGGNYGTGPITVGLATGVRLTGRIYQLIIRGAASNVDQIAAGEAWCNSKTRAF